MFILLAESLLTGSPRIVIWFMVFVALNLVHIPFVEEPALIARFGEPYSIYKRNVPRWLPRVKPWTAPWQHEQVETLSNHTP